VARPGLVADGFTHHPHTNGPTTEHTAIGIKNGGLNSLEPFMRDLRRLARQGKLNTPSGRALPVYLTEYGVHRPGSTSRFFRPPSEATRARWLAESVDVAAWMSGVRQLVLYGLHAPGAEQSWDTSLIDRDGSPTASFRGLVWLRAARATG
jgi:hypothetical protein